MPNTAPTTLKALAALAVGLLLSTVGQAEEPVQIETDLVVRGRVRRPQVFFLVPKADLAPIEKGAVRQDPVAEIVGLAASTPVATPTLEGHGLHAKSIVRSLRDQSR